MSVVLVSFGSCRSAWAIFNPILHYRQMLLLAGISSPYATKWATQKYCLLHRTEHMLTLLQWLYFVIFPLYTLIGLKMRIKCSGHFHWYGLITIILSMYLKNWWLSQPLLSSSLIFRKKTSPLVWVINRIRFSTKSRFDIENRFYVRCLNKPL